VGIGTDGMSPDLKVDVRTGYLMHKHDCQDPNLGWMEFQQMAMKNNPAIYQRLTGQKVGRIEPGYLADIILVDYYPVTPLNGDTFWGHFLYGVADSVVDTTIVNGEIVMRDKVIPGIDEAQIAEASQAVARETWERYQELSK
jgi:cytosine/adenosine deaminase-related metal-dependent hydrolase